MDEIAAFALAFLTGLTVAGLSGSAMELACGQRLSLSAPFVTHRRIVRSLAASAAAGPLMLANEALDAFHAGRIGRAGFGASLVASGVWMLATGIVVAELGLAARGW